MNYRGVSISATKKQDDKYRRPVASPSIAAMAHLLLLPLKDLIKATNKASGTAAIVRHTFSHLCHKPYHAPTRSSLPTISNMLCASFLAGALQNSTASSKLPIFYKPVRPCSGLAIRRDFYHQTEMTPRVFLGIAGWRRCATFLSEVSC